MIRRFQKRKGLVIADFGCGQAEFATALSGIHQVLSFDHVAIVDFVTACDMSKVPLEDQVLDAAVFSLSLMGKNFDQYLREAHRTLKIDGQLHLVEATSRFSDRHQFLQSLTQLGFDNLTVEDMSEKFTYIRGFKSDLDVSEATTIAF
jgi:ubiquinone/menaquinone biosynthesis C-methylase UbiE